MPEDEKSSSRETGLYFALGQAGLEMAAPLALGAVLDYWLQWGPWGVVVGAVVGFVGGTIHLIVMAQQIEREQSRKKSDE